MWHICNLFKHLRLNSSEKAYYDIIILLRCASIGNRRSCVPTQELFSLNPSCAPGATKLEVSNQGQFVVLEVDGSTGLVVGMQAEETEAALTGELRLALGGVLIDKEKMIVQVGLF